MHLQLLLTDIWQSRSLIDSVKISTASPCWSWTSFTTFSEERQEYMYLFLVLSYHIMECICGVEEGSIFAEHSTAWFRLLKVHPLDPGNE